MEKYNSRKWILTFAGLIDINILAAFKIISSGEFVSLFLFIVGGYSIANLVDKKNKTGG